MNEQQPKKMQDQGEEALEQFAPDVPVVRAAVRLARRRGALRRKECNLNKLAKDPSISAILDP